MNDDQKSKHGVEQEWVENAFLPVKKNLLTGTKTIRLAYKNDAVRIWLGHRHFHEPDARAVKFVEIDT